MRDQDDLRATFKTGASLFTAIVLLLAAAMACFGQSVSGELVGTIYDQSHAVVPDATVVATNLATGVQSTATSTAAGRYRIPNLPVGTYKLTVIATGFTKAELTNINVELNTPATANFTLQVGQTATSVEVSGAGAMIDTTTAQVGTSFAPRQLEDLPITAGGSGVINLSLLSAGVSTSGAVGVGSGPSVGGQRPRNNNFTVEGIDNNSKSTTGPLSTIPNDAVADFTLLANQFSPEYGHSAGGQFNQVVKSGTNEFHGMLTEYLQNRNLNAADQQSIVSGVDPHPRYDDNRFGGNIGGPIKKNKLFFFADIEREAYGAAGVPGQIFAPTQAGYNTLASISGISQTNLSILKQYLPPTPTATGPGDTPMGAYPVIGGKTIELGQMSFLAPNYQNNTYTVGSVDYSIGTNDQLRGRYIMQRTSFIDTAATLPTFFDTVPVNDYLVTLSEFHNFSSSLTNEFRLGFNRNYQVYGVGSQKYPGLDMFPNVTVDELGVNIGPDPNAPQTTIQNTYQGTNNLSWIKGAHSLKFGVDFRKYISPQTFTQRARGDYEWATLDGFLHDDVPDFAERTTGNVVYYGDQTEFGAYANDDWRVRPNLTLNLGVRYERTTVPYGERSQVLNAISNVPGLITFSEPKVQNLNFMPRIGFAWSPGTKGNTSIRGGFGMNYDKLFDNLGILSMPPQLQQTVDVGGMAGSAFLANGGIKPNASSGTLSQADARAETGGYIPDQKLPKAIQWNLGVQHVWRQDYTFEVRYLGTRGLDLPVQQRINAQSVVTAQNALPLYYSMPSQAQLNSLTSNLTQLNKLYNAGGFFLPQYLNAGFESNITSYMPQGSSNYQGLALQANRRFSNGMQFIGSYTWSHNIDNSTAEVFSTVTTPRRAQDFQNLTAERSDSALDHRQRFTFAMVYDMPYFKKHEKWFMRNVVGNWELAPIVTYQTGSWATVQSAVDANLNGDSAGDRTVINPNGTVNIGSGVTALKNSNGDVVAYLANNPNARYIQAQKGMLTDGARNTMHLMPIDDIDLSLVKRVNIGERFKVEMSGRFVNFLNHPQYTGDRMSDVLSKGYTGQDVRNFLTPSYTSFYHPDMVFSSNPRSTTIAVKLIF